MSRESSPIIIYTHSEQQRVERPTNTQMVPARVQVAMHFVEHFTHKTEVKALPVKKGFDDGLEYEPLERVVLTIEEKDAYNAALALMQEYFDGSMRESSLEIVERGRLEEKLKQARLEGGPVMVMVCPQCKGGDKRSICLLCRTKGEIIVGMVP